MATCVQRAAVIQSTSRSSSRVVVPNVRTSWRRRAPSLGERRHAVTLALCTSQPAADGVEHVHRRPHFLCRVVRRSPQGRYYARRPAAGTQQSGVPGSAWVPILRGLSGTILQPTSTPSLHHILVPRRGLFMRRGCPPTGGHGSILRKWGGVPHHAARGVSVPA